MRRYRLVDWAHSSSEGWGMCQYTHRLFGGRRVVGPWYWFVGFSLIDLFVGFTGGAEARFEFFDEPKGKAFLPFSCASAKRTIEALFRLLAVLFGNDFGLHKLFLWERNPAMNCAANYIKLARLCSQ